MAALTKGDLRDYVQTGERVTGEGWVLLDFTHNLTTRRFVEIGFHIDTLIEDVKMKLYTHCGTNLEFMELRHNGVSMEDEKPLYEYNVRTGDVISIIDHDPNSVAANGGLDDVSQVERYRMSDEDYDKRANTYRAYKKKMLQEDPNWLPPWVIKEREKRAAERAANPLEPIESVQARFTIGARCEAFPGGRRGEIKYIGYIGSGPKTYSDGYVEEAPVFIGIKFDEPVGKNDGTYKGVRYFDCQQGYGAFIKPMYVKMGDYPERDPFASDDEEEEEQNDVAEGEDLMEEL